MRAEVGLASRYFAISIHINLFLFGRCCEFAFSIFGFLFHFLFLGFCLLVDFDLLENGLLTLFVYSVSLLPGCFRCRIRVFIVYFLLLGFCLLVDLVFRVRLLRPMRPGWAQTFIIGSHVVPSCLVIFFCVTRWFSLLSFHLADFFIVYKKRVDR